MSELLVNTIKKADGTGSLTVPAESGTVVTTASPSLGRRNLIINGAMQVAQRGNTTNDNGVFVADRFAFQTNGLGGAGAVIAASTQSTVVPSGFASALKTNVTTAGSGFNADNRDGFTTALEHQDITHLIDAGNSFTLSFWVRSSLATTYGVTLTLADRDTSSTGDRYATSYTINAVNTWEKKTITIPAPTSSRSGGSDNGTGIVIYWNLEMISGGSRSSASADAWEDAGVSHAVVSAAADTGWMSSTNDFYITGVQLEVGSVATPFEHRSYGEELALCQRYFTRGNFYTSVMTGTPGGTYYFNHAGISFPCEMRAQPSATNNGSVHLGTWSSGTTVAAGNVNGFNIGFNGSSQKLGGILGWNATSGNAPLPANGPGGGSSYSNNFDDVSLDAEL